MTAFPLCPREDALDAVGVAGAGDVARALARRLLALPSDRLRRLRGVAAPDLVVALADDAADLPWVDGVVYLGRDPDAPRLLLPTTLRPAVAADALERAVMRRATPRPGPWALLAAPARIVPLAEARPIAPGPLRAYLGEAA